MSLKEDALAKFAPGALSMVSEFTANINPENEVAQFIDENISILSKTKEDDGSDVAHGLLQKLSVAEANNDPEFSLSKLLAFYEQFRVWYLEYTTPINWTVDNPAPPPEPTEVIIYQTKDGQTRMEVHPEKIDSDVEIKEDTGYVSPLNIDLTNDNDTDSE